MKTGIMEKQTDERKINEKVLAMYQAVFDFMSEGNDVSRLKVSEITQRAGIGKGTAYEYFRSKDELVEQALEYNFMLRYQELEKATDDRKTLREAVESCFDWICKNFRINEMLWQCVRVFQNREKAKLSENVTLFQENINRKVEMFSSILEKLFLLGKKEGLIPDGMPHLMAQLAMFSQFLGYFTYIGLVKNHKQVEEQQIREFFYQSMIRSFQAEDSRG